MFLVLSLSSSSNSSSKSESADANTLIATFPRAPNTSDSVRIKCRELLSSALQTGGKLGQTVLAYADQFPMLIGFAYSDAQKQIIQLIECEIPEILKRTYTSKAKIKHSYYC